GKQERNKSGDKSPHSKSGKKQRNKGVQAALKTTQVLLPPKPKALEAATRTRRGCASRATWQSGHAGSGCSRVMGGGTACACNAPRQAPAFRAAAPDSKCPVMLLTELTGTRSTSSPITRCNTRASAMSPTGVLVA